MFRYIFISWLITFCLMQSAESTNKFLQNLLTTTSPSTHISDYRKQRRTDSRADKPDTFPGFDLHEDSTTPSSRKRRRQAYSQLIRLFIQNTRDRLETIRDVIKDESELHFRLTRPLDDVNESHNNEQIRFLSENDDNANRQFIDLAFSDALTANDESTNIVKPTSPHIENASQTYLNSLFAAVGYSRITSTTTPSPMENDEGNVITKYILSPLFRLWFRTQEQFNVDSSDNDANKANEMDAAQFRINFGDSNVDTDIQLEAKTESKIIETTNQKVSEYRVPAMNYSLPFMMLSLNNEASVPTVNLDTDFVTDKPNENTGLSDADDDDEHNVDNEKKQNNSVAEAATAFQSAFYKYANGTEGGDAGGSSAKLQRIESTKNAELLSADVLIGGLFEGNKSHIQVVPTKKSKSNELNSVDDDGFKSVAGFQSDSMKSFGENAGVLILEIFGTIVGSTWKALSQIPSYFNGQN